MTLAARADQVRPADPADATRVADLRAAALRDRASTAYDDDQIDALTRDGAWESSSLRSVIASEGTPAVVAEREGRVVGYGDLDLSADRVGAVYVDPAYARRGIGRSLLERLETLAERAGRRELTVLASHNATGFYDRFGYEFVCEQTQCVDGVEVPVAVMYRRLG